MSLETEIKALTAEVKGLREEIALITQRAADNAGVDKQDAVDAVNKSRNGDASEAEAEAEFEADSQAITADSLQQRCLAIVRKNRNKKAQLKQAIKDVAGVGSLRQVPQDKLAAVSEAIDAVEGD